MRGTAVLMRLKMPSSWSWSSWSWSDNCLRFSPVVGTDGSGGRSAADMVRAVRFGRGGAGRNGLPRNGMAMVLVQSAEGATGHGGEGVRAGPKSAVGVRGSQEAGAAGVKAATGA